ncbi:transglutaminase family protein [Nocardioides sp. GY 10113]|uniref:transglutaminase family protein n=1 Tax=Nocardioides sp. GY 10113 TaxID=2569761 RepID=UPI0010A7734F|nr:transglutaminase family protein [Nocardioides sp. GY 10113]TIC84986.1 transglutaminase family protein [Nocardioides sp. GY 10113]
MRYRVEHRTTYTYDDHVTDSLGVAHLVPRSLPWQQLGTGDGEYRVAVTPTPDDHSSEVDFYGNRVTYFQVVTPHRELQVVGRGEVDVVTPVVDEERLATRWERFRPLLDPGAPGAWRATDFALASPAVPIHPGARDYAAESLTRGRPVGEAVTELMNRIHADFDYDPSATTVTSTVPEIIARRAGVCQDFAHFTLAGLRAHGLAARYVSGYLATEPPPGKERVVGADASHAWLALWLGDDEWLAFDPTNDQWQNERYVTVAWGRDYGDVPPVKGVIFTEATTSELSVSVDVAPIG